MKRTLFVLAAALIVVSTAAAGDVPELVNLGFSPDSAFFLFGQYGIDEATGQPYAELYLVDTKRNEFVPQGAVRKSFPTKLEPGQDPAGALFALYAEHVEAVKKRRIDHLKQGRLIYVLLNGAPQADALQFQDFKTQAQYGVKLAQSVVERNGAASSSFGISVTVTGKDGIVKRFEAGNPTYSRDGVAGYAIRRILVAPDERTLVFIVEKKLSSAKGAGYSYMVETVLVP
ncbi:MAG: DUF2259 domain-containing protein [Spirochaetes bacterium]|nr:DUF2259 domain-containing protein [Spirochaetota bacterium]